MSSEEHGRLAVIDGRDALAGVLIRPGQTDDHITLEAWAKGIDKPHAARVLRHVADVWAPRIGLAGVLDEVAAERALQDAKWGEQNHLDGTGNKSQQDYADQARKWCQAAFGSGYGTWSDVLAEEVAEANAERDPAKLRAELIQVAAVAVNWIEAIDRRTNTLPALLQAVAEQLPADNPQQASETLTAMPRPGTVEDTAEPQS